MTKDGSAGRAEAARRFGRSCSAGHDHGVSANGRAGHAASIYAPPGLPKDRQWTLEHLFEHPQLPAIARADVRYHGNASARRALADLARANREADADADTEQED